MSRRERDRERDCKACNQEGKKQTLSEHSLRRSENRRMERGRLSAVSRKESRSRVREERRDLRLAGPE